MSRTVSREQQVVAMTSVGNFADGYRSWDRMISNARSDKRADVFRNCCSEGARFVAHGADRATVADELTTLARRHNFDETLGGDAGVQQVIADAFRKSDRKVAGEVAENRGRWERRHSGDLPDVNTSQPLHRDRTHAPARRARLDVVCMADVTPVPIEWLWPNRIAVGKVSVLAGYGALGKSTLLCDWAARTTTGGVWPDRAAAGPAGSVIILVSEDDLGDTLVPRLMAAGADLSRIQVVRSLVDDDNRRRGFNLQADLQMLEDLIRQLGDVRAVILDPVTSYLGKVDSHKNADVRAVLGPLGEMAARMRVAVIANNHFSKSGGSANNRIIGSVAFVNQARSAFIVTPDEDDKTRRLLIPSKTNIGPDQHGLAYRIEGCLVAHDGKDIATSRIMYETAPVTISADQALAALDANNSENRSRKDEAEDFLTYLLSGGPVSAKDIKRKAADDGISWASVRRAQKTLGIKPAREGFGTDGKSIWSLR